MGPPSPSPEMEDLTAVEAAADAIEVAVAPVIDNPGRRSDAKNFHSVLEGRLYVGGAEVLGDQLRDLGVDHVVRVLGRPAAEGLALPWVIPQEDLKGSLVVEALDIMTTDLRPEFPKIHAFIAKALKSGGCVYVHCGQGRSRAATSTISYLMQGEGMDLRTAFTHLLSRRDISAINLSFLSQLVDLDEDLYGRRSLPLLAAHLAKRRLATAVRTSSQRLTVPELLEFLRDPNARTGELTDSMANVQGLRRTRELTDSMAYVSVQCGMRELRQLLDLETSLLGPCPVTRCAAELRSWVDSHLGPAPTAAPEPGPSDAPDAAAAGAAPPSDV